MRSPRLTLALLALLPMASLAVDGDSSGDDPPATGIEAASQRSHALFREAEAAFAEGNWSEALEKYRAAYAILPRPGLHARIGSCLQALNEHQAAIESFELYLAEAPRAPNRVEIEEKIEESREALSSLLLPLAQLVEPSTAAEEDAQGDDILPIVALSTEEDPPTDSIEIPTTDEETQVELTPAWAYVPAEPEDPEDRARSAMYERWWFWAAIGAGVAMAGGATYAGTRPDPVYVLPSGTLGSADWR